MNTQIYATFGPSCGGETILKQMIEVGMTGMRLNLSHTTLPASEEYIRAYQRVAEELGVIPQILIDMQGPELRVGQLTEPVVLEEGAYCRLCSELLAYGKEGHSVNGIPVPQVVIQAAQAGDEILLDDGKLLLEVTRSDSESDHTIQGKVIRGGIIHGHKSIKIVGKDVQMPALTDHDIDNLKLAKDYGVTALMQPFVRSSEDLKYVRKVLKAHGAEEVQIFAKIENRAGVDNLEQLLPEADVIIIARGDLGNDMPLWELPRVQKQIEAACKVHNKPYVVVTQMLSSMEQNPVPTRAEVSDIFHAVYHGAWGVMITGESAIGKYPVEAVRYLANVAREAEGVVC